MDSFKFLFTLLPNFGHRGISHSVQFMDEYVGVHSHLDQNGQEKEVWLRCEHPLFVSNHLLDSFTRGYYRLHQIFRR